MKARTRALNQLGCGCYRYCDDCVDSRPDGLKDLEFSRSLSEVFGEAWGDQGHWEATEFSTLTGAEGAARKQDYS